LPQTENIVQQFSVVLIKKKATRSAAGFGSDLLLDIIVVLLVDIPVLDCVSACHTIGICWL
jgi:hypothetical protein